MSSLPQGACPSLKHPKCDGVDEGQWAKLRNVIPYMHVPYDLLVLTRFPIMRSRERYPMLEPNEGLQLPYF